MGAAMVTMIDVPDDGTNARLVEMPIRELPDLQLRYIRGGRRRLYVITSDFSYSSVVRGISLRVVPKGRTTDFASVPHVLQMVFPADEFGEAAVAHDDLYRFDSCSRKQADLVFLEFALRRAVHEESLRMVAKAAAMFIGLRIGGWWTWRKYRKAEKRAAERQTTNGKC